MRGKDRQGDRPVCYCSVCGGELYAGEMWTEQEGSAVCRTCTAQREAITNATEETGMNHTNQPIYRRGNRKCYQIRVSLALLQRYRDGEQLTGEEQAVARLMEANLTEKELEYLSCYYIQGLTHRQIARQLRRSASTVSKGIVRAERKFWAFGELTPI